MNQDHVERELQFEAPDLLKVEAWIGLQPSNGAVTVGLEKEATQHDTYLDSVDWAIYNAGYSLRLRRLPDRGEATLKALTERSNGAQQRREINQAISADEPEWAGNSGPVSEKVRLLVGGAPIQSLFAIETRRRNYTLGRNGDAQAVLSLDDATLKKGEQDSAPAAPCRSRGGARRRIASVQVFVDALERACALQPAKTSKFEEGLQAAELSPDAALDFGYAELEADASAGEFAYALLRRYLGDFIRHEPGTRLGEDTEELHQMRVATRRLRAAMSTFRPVLPLRFQTHRQELQWFGRVLVRFETWTSSSSG